MQLLYFFSKKSDGRVMKANLSSIYDIEFNEVTNELNIRKNENISKKMREFIFDKTNIEDILVYVGGNGAGKTSLLREIYNVYTQMFYGIFVFESKGMLYCQNSLKSKGYKHLEHNIGAITKELKDIKYINKSLECKTVSYDSRKQLEEETEKFTGIFFSNVFDNTRSGRVFNDISTNSKIRTRDNVSDYDREVLSNYVNVAGINEIPEIDKLKFSYVPHRQYEGRGELQLQECDQIMLSYLAPHNYQRDLENKNIALLLEFMYFNCRKIILEYPNKLSNILDEINTDNKLLDNFKIFFENVKTILPRLSNRVDSVLKIADFLIGEWVDEDAIISHSHILYLYDLIEKSDKEVKETIEIGIPTLSSGEVALLNMYSRFYDLKKNNNGIRNATDITIFIDECDAYLHYDNQRVMISRLNKMCSLLFPDNKIYLILTTHSPIILSDITGINVYNILNDGCTIQSKRIDDETFGQNIHSLLRKKFSLDSTTGEFAVDVINKIIQKLKNIDGERKLRNEELQLIEEMIERIGEKVIQRYLKELLNEYKNI